MAIYDYKPTRDDELAIREGRMVAMVMMTYRPAADVTPVCCAEGIVHNTDT